MNWSINGKTVKSLMKDGKEIVKVERVEDGKVLYEKESNYTIATFSGNKITLGTNGNPPWIMSDSDVVIDWGDGTSDTVNNPTMSLSHTYTDGGSEHSIVFLGTVTSLGNSCFLRCTGLTSITIPNSVTSLGDICFYGCTGLTSIVIPESVTSLGEYCFYGCTGLTSVTIPNSVTSLGVACFYGCTGLTSVTIPNSVTSLGEYCFYGCTGLTSVTIPNSVTSLGDRCFRGCTGLTSVTIPSSVTSLGNTCFYDCTGLTSVTIPSSVTSLGNFCFRFCDSLIDYQLYWTGDSIITYNSSKMHNNTNTKFYVPKDQKTNYVNKSYPSAKVVERDT